MRPPCGMVLVCRMPTGKIGTVVCKPEVAPMFGVGYGSLGKKPNLCFGADNNSNVHGGPGNDRGPRFVSEVSRRAW